MERPYEAMNDSVGPMSYSLLAGKSVTIPFGNNERIGYDTRLRILRGAGGGYLYVMGWIEYPRRWVRY